MGHHTRWSINNFALPLERIWVSQTISAGPRYLLGSIVFIGAWIGYIAEPFMIDAEGEGIPAVYTADPKNEDSIVIFIAPKWNLAGITAVRSDHQLGEFVEFTVFPGHENQCVLIIGFSKFDSQVIDLSVAKLRIDWEFTPNGGGCDGHEWANVVIIATIKSLLRVRRKDKTRFSVL
jgi:hypothetical protein